MTVMTVMTVIGQFRDSTIVMTVMTVTAPVGDEPSQLRRAASPDNILEASLGVGRTTNQCCCCARVRHIHANA
jgi:hypothetical protein